MSNKDLIPNFSISDLPALNDASEIAKFAHKFDGYKYYGSFELCSKMASEKRRESLPDILNELFFACRAARHGGGNDEVEVYKELKPYLERYAKMNDVESQYELTLHDILTRHDFNFDAAEYKIHFACWNGIEDPLDVYLSGQWKEWQEGQTKRNFERKYIISLIQLSRRDHWLFVGLYASNGVVAKDGNLYKYSTSPISKFNSISGRLVLEYKKDYRNSYPYAENVTKQMGVYEIKPQSVAVNEFIGYSSIFVSFGQLQHIITTANGSWKGALSSVNGVYLITDSRTGKLYVGSAYGTEGIWGRWSEYINDGHGGNKVLKELNGFNPEFKRGLHYSILEIVDKSASNEFVIERESDWKNRLGTRINGYNAN
jgi:hypothetical protein